MKLKRGLLFLLLLIGIISLSFNNVNAESSVIQELNDGASNTVEVTRTSSISENKDSGDKSLKVKFEITNAVSNITEWNIGFSFDTSRLSLTKANTLINESSVGYLTAPDLFTGTILKEGNYIELTFNILSEDEATVNSQERPFYWVELNVSKTEIKVDDNKLKVVLLDGGLTQDISESKETLATFIPTGDVISVDLSWGSLRYVCTETWNIQEHKYDYIWKPQTAGADEVTIKNNSNVAVDVIFEWETLVTGVSGSFSGEGVTDGKVNVAAASTIGAEVSKTVKINLSGMPNTRELYNTAVGKVTVTIKK